MTDSELLRLMLGPGATDDRATNERLAAAVALAKDNDGTCCAQCGERLKGDRALRMGVCGLCEDESV